MIVLLILSYDAYFLDHSSIVNIKNISKNVTDTFSFKHITCDEMYKALSCVNSKKATGCDQLPGKVLKDSAMTNALPCTQMVDSNIFPYDAKLAEVTPIFKKENPLLKKNYRPVSVLPSLSNVFEKLLLVQMQPHIDVILSDRMSAFRAGFSCQHVLLAMGERWREAIENKKLVGAVLVDRSKAFCCLPHTLLILYLFIYLFG